MIEEGSRNISHVSERRFGWEPRGFRYNGGRFRDMPTPLSPSPATAASTEEEDCHPCSRRPEKSKLSIFNSNYRKIHSLYIATSLKSLCLFCSQGERLVKYVISFRPSVLSPTFVSFRYCLKIEQELLKLRHFKVK